MLSHILYRCRSCHHENHLAVWEKEICGKCGSHHLAFYSQLYFCELCQKHVALRHWNFFRCPSCFNPYLKTVHVPIYGPLYQRGDRHDQRLSPLLDILCFACFYQGELYASDPEICPDCGCLDLGFFPQPKKCQDCSQSMLHRHWDDLQCPRCGSLDIEDDRDQLEMGEPYERRDTRASCEICFQAIEDPMVKLPCQHVCHEKCLPSRVTRSTCPTCHPKKMGSSLDI